LPLSPFGWCLSFLAIALQHSLFRQWHFTVWPGWL
jgi:hypothetical protein